MIISACPHLILRNILYNHVLYMRSFFLPLSHAHTDAHIHTESVVFSTDPFLFVEVSSSTVQTQTVSVAVKVCLVGFPVSVGSKAGFVSVFFATGRVRLIEVNLHCLTARPQFGVKKVTPCPDSVPVQSMVPVRTAAVVLALRRAATQTPVIKLSVASAT